MDDGGARHIGDIIRERSNRAARHPAATSSSEHDPFSAVLKALRLLLGAMLDMLAMIGWFVTLPFITHGSGRLTSRAHRRG